MTAGLFKKGMVLGIICLFIGASIVSGRIDEIEKLEDHTVFNKINMDTLTFYPTDDTWIWMEKPDSNRGSNTYMSVRNMYGHHSHPEHWEIDSLIKFDLSSISQDIYINNAKLFIYYWGCGFDNCQRRDLTCHIIKSNWNEEDVTWNTRPIYDSETFSSSIIPPSFGWMEWDVTDDVELFVNGQVDNHGWQIMDLTYWGKYDVPTTKFYTKEYSDSNYHPYLEIEIDEEAPYCEITVPVEGYLHIFNFPTRIKTGVTIIFGAINIRVSANDIGGSGMDRVEFYVDDVLKHNTTEIPYNWLCTDRMLGTHTLKAIAYDKAGNKGESQEIAAFWFIFL